MRLTSAGLSAVSVHSGNAAAISRSVLPGAEYCIFSGGKPIEAASFTSARLAASAPKPRDRMLRSTCGFGLAFMEYRNSACGKSRRRVSAARMIALSSYR